MVGAIALRVCALNKLINRVLRWRCFRPKPALYLTTDSEYRMSVEGLRQLALISKTTLATAIAKPNGGIIPQQFAIVREALSREYSLFRQLHETS